MKKAHYNLTLHAKIQQPTHNTENENSVGKLEGSRVLLLSTFSKLGSNKEWASTVAKWKLSHHYLFLFCRQISMTSLSNPIIKCYLPKEYKNCSESQLKRKILQLVCYQTSGSVTDRVVHQNPCSNWDIERINHPVHWNTAIQIW